VRAKLNENQYVGIIGIIFIIILLIILFKPSNNESGISISDNEQQYTKAIDLIEQQEYEKAEEILQKLILNNPTIGKYDLALGTLYRKQNKWDKAKEYYMQSIEKSPDLKEGYNNLTGIQMMENDLEGAFKTVEEGLSRHPENKDLIFKKAQLLYVSGQEEEAKPLFEMLLDDPKYPEAREFYEGDR